jgi:hypothetical protein
MERKESGAYPYVFRDFHVTSMNDYDIMHVAAATDLFKYQFLFTSITVMC